MGKTEEGEVRETMSEKTEETGDKRQETRDKRQETRDKRQEREKMSIKLHIILLVSKLHQLSYLKRN